MTKNSHQQFLLAQKKQQELVSTAAKQTQIPKEALKILAGSVHPQQVNPRNTLSFYTKKS
jgi:hypothetical protein